MPDFSKLLKKPAGEAKRPPALPAGDFLGIVKGHELKEAPQGKDYDVIVRINLALREWPDTVDQSDREGIDLAKRPMRRDFFIDTNDPNGTWRLEELVRSCGVELSGRSLEEVLPDLTGSEVIVEVQQYMSERTNEVGNQVGKLVGLSG